ncbi:uncharacterized protein BDV14DRAFT_200186 [Aspergillus stella-maris]|uniref:uncharacterized protein n=1 Tax=Aspergillus stella-maris TaxID=1810926 RepID=UPI003CCCE4AC
MSPLEKREIVSGSRQASVLGVGGAFVAFISAIVAARVYVRLVILRALGTDDSKNTSSCDPRFESFNVQGARWQCLLPCGYEELSLRLQGCSDFRIILRSASDKSPEEWRKTIEYAAEELQKAEERGPDFRWSHEAKGSPVVVAFD